MGFLSSIQFPRREDSTTKVSMASYTVQGEMHRLKDIPNQDRVFTYNRKSSISSTPTIRDSNSSKYSTASSIGSGSDLSGVPERLATVDGVYAVGVFDGHGEEGHMAASLAMRYMESTLDRLLGEDEELETQNKGNSDGESMKLEPRSLEEVLEKAFHCVAKGLESDPCAAGNGTTASVALVRGSEVCIGHVGDSCAVYVSQAGNKKRLMSKYVTRMHRPGIIEREDERVRKMGGLLMDGYVVDKVSKQKGISVTRTLGDTDMRVNGCVSVPDVVTFGLSKDDRAIVLATDGLWDTDGVVLKDVMKAVTKSNTTPRESCEFLADVVKTLSGPTDDCTIACIRFHR